MYRINLYNKWASEEDWRLVKTNEFDSEDKYLKLLAQKKKWCENITAPLDEATVQLRAKLVCEKLVDEEWQIVEETEYGV